MYVGWYGENSCQVILSMLVLEYENNPDTCGKCEDKVLWETQ